MNPIPAFVLFALALTVRGARVFYVNQPELQAGQINAVKPDGTGHTTLWTSPAVSDVRGIAVDPPNARLFFAHARQDAATLALTEVSLRTLPVTGGSPAVVTSFPDGTFLGDVEWEPASNWVYAAQPVNLQLKRVRPDGSAVETVLTHTAAGQGPYFLSIDAIDQRAYWGVLTSPGETGTAYSRGTLDGAVDAAWTMVTPSRTRDIAVDHSVPGGRLFWCDRQNGAVYVRAVDGGAVQTVITGLNAPHGLALDVEANRGYVADTGKRGSGSQASSHRVIRFNLDGTGGLEFLSAVSTIAEPWDVTIDTTTVSYADWRTRYFASTDPAAGPAGDPDGDGTNNAAEYAFFTNPRRRDTVGASVEAAGAGIRYARRRVTNSVIRVEVSTDLSAWHWNGEAPGAVWTVEQSVSPRDEDSVWVTAVPAASLNGAGRVYFRVRASQP